MTKKYCLLITIILSLLLIVAPISVKALENTYSGGTIMRLADGEIVAEDCTGYLTTDAISLIHELLSYFRILAPSLVIIFSAIDFTRAVLGKYDNKEDALETAKIKVGKRLLACLILIFIPTILKVILTSVEDEVKIDASCVDQLNG